MEDKIRKQQEKEMFNDVLILASHVRRNSCLKYIEKLFRYISLVTEERHFEPNFDDLPFVVPLFHEKTHKAVKIVLPLMDAEIQRLFKSVKEGLVLKNNLRAYITRLGLFLCTSPYSLIYFFTVTARIFALMLKSHQTMSPVFFIETVVDIFGKNEARVKSFGGLNAMNNLVENIMKDKSLVKDLPPFKCNELLMYF